MFVPLLNTVMLLVFAYSEWPIQRELREMRAWAAQAGRAPVGGYGPAGGAVPNPGATHPRQ